MSNKKRKRSSAELKLEEISAGFLKKLCAGIEKPRSKEAFVPARPKKPEPKCVRVTELSQYRGRPQVLILVGLQGSGKTTFAKRLKPHGWATVSQDALGKKRALCEVEAKAHLSNGVSVIIDRCNFDETQRAHWIKMAAKFGCAVGCILFAVSVDECIDRVQKRQYHHTLRRGEKSKSIIRDTACEFKPPRKEEGLLYCRTVRRTVDANRVLKEAIAGFRLISE